MAKKAFHLDLFHLKTCRLLFSFCFLLFIETEAQPLSFTHLNTSDGLSENNVRSLAIDKTGFLWIGTTDGLNVFDGYNVTSYKKENQPQIASNDVIHLTCDSRNRIWLGSSEGVTWIDGYRRFHRVVLNDSVTRFGCRTIMDTKKYGPVLYTNLGQYFFNEQKEKWEKLTWIPDQLKYERFHDAEPFDENKIIYATDSLVMIVDYAKNKIVYEQPFAAVFSLCRYSDHELAIGLQHGKIQIADINKNKIVKEYQVTSELNKKRINSTITEVRLAPDGNLLIATDYAGLVIIDRAGNMANYTHDPINPRSIGGNTTWRVLSGRNGDIVVGTNNAGVSIFNIYNKEAGYTRIFSDGHGSFYDTYVSEMAQDKNGILWVGALERLIRWDKVNNQVKFFYYYSAPIWTGAQNLEIRSLCVDKRGRIWVSALGDGISILNEKTGQFNEIRRDTSLNAAVKNNYVFELYAASDDHIWVGTQNGMYTIHSATFEISSFSNHPVLKTVAGFRVNAFLEDKAGNMWMATYNGVYRYDKKNNRLDNFTVKNGLVANQCFNLFEDSRGNIYVGTLKGFSIIKDGVIRSYNRSNGLKYDYCEGIMEDNQGKIWIANTKCMIRFNPEKETMQYFGENSGFSTEGYRMNSHLKSNTGELFWGSRIGINYFFPEQLINRPADLKVNIFQADMRDSIVNLGATNELSLKYRDNDIIFRFTAINLKGSNGIQYQYMLEGYDKEWQNGIDVRQARYSSLPAGNYLFKVKARLDGRTWVNASNRVALTIIPPLWQQWWFIGGFLALLIGFIYWFISSRNKKIEEQREEIEMEQAINYFASSMSEQQTEENILWDVAKNCIGRLQFEDCVIYVFDEEKNVLVQKAAHGPKSPKQFEIDSPIEIEAGKGIVGSVAVSGKAEIIDDTTKDTRYIVDDEQRYSEITVPIIYDGKILGVIDCEHSKKRFFTQKHLSILTTIASLCANKIVRARAEEEKREAQMILMSTQQKMTEVEMQALRAQMNPHFIFNCLNSINRYIVKSDQTTASLYLTKFAKLIRLILDNSNSKNVILTNELEALKLYIEMEALRFDKKFTYEIKVESNLGTDTVELPPLIIQPYVENAIWHGLLHKESNGHLSVRVSMTGDSMLQCIIEDNGIGREKAKTLKSKTATSRKSLGMQLTENRLSLLNKHAELNASVEIIDLQDEGSEAGGTKVILKIPV
jgi:ligand-binding sensor domain-containing protein/putative methionine-R-sulfoxide reductase with GAF domain